MISRAYSSAGWSSPSCWAGLSGLAFAQVEVQAAKQQPQPASGHQQIAVLPQR